MLGDCHAVSASRHLGLQSLGGSIELDVTYSLTWLATDVECLLQAHVRLPTRVPAHGLSIWLGLLTAGFQDGASQ